MRISGIGRKEEIPLQQREVPSQTSPFRTVFGSEVLRGEFVKFLKTIFYQLDDAKVLKEMDRILADPKKTDKEVYEELVQNIDHMRKRFPMRK